MTEYKKKKNIAGIIIAILLILIGIALIACGIYLRYYEENNQVLFYINEYINSFLGVTDLSIITGAIIIVGVIILCILGKIKSKTARIVSRIIVLVAMAAGWYYFFGVCTLSTMWNEIYEIHSPEKERMVVVYNQPPFLDEGQSFVYVKMNDAFIKPIMCEEDAATYYFSTPDSMIAWNDEGFILVDEGNNVYSYIYPSNKNISYH